VANLEGGRGDREKCGMWLSSCINKLQSTFIISCLN